MNGWTRDGQEKYNDLMVKVRNDRVNYGKAFDNCFLKFCRQMEEKSLLKSPKKRKRAEVIPIYLDNTIPEMNRENWTDEFKNQVRTTNEEIEKREFTPLGNEYI